MEQIFQHPASHNLEWHDVITLVEHVGTVEESGNGHVTFKVEGVSKLFHRSQEKDVSDIQQVLDLRHFFESPGIDSHPNIDAQESQFESHLQLVVVINRQETLVFRSEGKSSTPEHLYPYDPHGLLHHLNHTDGPDISSREPENITYYQEIAKSIAGAHEVLLMGNGTGGSSAMTHLRDYLNVHDPQIAKTIVGAVTMDLEALTEGQLLEESRAFFLDHAGPDSRK